MSIIKDSELLRCNWESHKFLSDALGHSDSQLDLHFCTEHWAKNMLSIGQSIARTKAGPIIYPLLQALLWSPP